MFGSFWDRHIDCINNEWDELGNGRYQIDNVAFCSTCINDSCAIHGLVSMGHRMFWNKSALPRSEMAHDKGANRLRSIFDGGDFGVFSNENLEASVTIGPCVG